MGGLADGGTASRTAISLVAERVIQELLLAGISGQAGSGGQRTVSEVLTAALQTASAAIFKAARRAGVPSGTTFSSVVLFGRQMVAAHVGDSRIYLEGADGLTPITEDHSMVARLLAMGQLTAEEARDNPQRNMLYRSLGQTEQVEVQSMSYAWRGYSRVLLCSDGLWDQVGDRDLRAILDAQPDSETAADQLVGLANERGGPDNISLILVDLPREQA
ncbi:MAG TPA: protein phosphatase 2C domain-containing protein, partial [Chloroflexia bacterium]|nr:protein phosphatase 2C domain-containing protein [Chloroflexia bacterium]